MRSAQGHSQIPRTAHGLRTPMAGAEVRRGMRGDVAGRRLYGCVYRRGDTLRLGRRRGIGWLRDGQATGFGCMHRLRQPALLWGINIYGRVWRLHRDRGFPRSELCERVDRTNRLRGEGGMERDVRLLGRRRFRYLHRFCCRFVRWRRWLPTRVTSFPLSLLLGGCCRRLLRRRFVPRISFGTWRWTARRVVTEATFRGSRSSR